MDNFVFCLPGGDQVRSRPSAASLIKTDENKLLPCIEERISYIFIFIVVISSLQSKGAS